MREAGHFMRREGLVELKRRLRFFSLLFIVLYPVCTTAAPLKTLASLEQHTVRRSLFQLLRIPPRTPTVWRTELAAHRAQIHHVSILSVIGSHNLDEHCMLRHAAAVAGGWAPRPANALSVLLRSFSGTAVRCRDAGKRPSALRKLQGDVGTDNGAAPVAVARAAAEVAAVKRTPRSRRGDKTARRAKESAPAPHWTSRERPVALFSTVYFSEAPVRDAAPATEARAKAERQSIAKLLIISQSVGSIFCAMPGSKSVEDYVSEVEGAAPSAGGSPTAPEVVSERVLAEEQADHLFCLHVRDMEQLLPPDHLAATPAHAPTKAGLGRKKKAMDPVDRLKALHRWRFDALRRSQLALEQHAVPNHVHGITRLRLHEPSKVDVTVVQSCGGPKTPEDVLAALNRFTQCSDDESHRVAEAETEAMKAIFLAAFTQQVPGAAASLAALSVASPFSIKPLLTVYASCLPRREELLGVPAQPRRIYTETSCASGSANAITTLGIRKLVHRLLMLRQVPGVPRHSTRLTLMVEHNAMDPADLISLAEMTTERKSKAESKPTPEVSTLPPRIYCLITDGSKV
eukprot:gene7231-5082_t